MVASSKKVCRAFFDGVPMKVIRPSRYVPIKTSDEIKKNAKVKFLKDGTCKVTCFNKPTYILPGYEVNDRFERVEILQSADKPNQKKTSTAGESANEKSIKRAKDKIFEISAANDWSYMVTFTLDKKKVDRYDPIEVQKSFSGWLYNCAKRKDLCALVVPELHKDGAIHFHGLINNALKTEHSGTYKVKGYKKPIGSAKLRKMGKTTKDNDVKVVYNLPEYPLGFATAIRLTGNGYSEFYEEVSESVSKVAFYMTKYCTKDLDKIFGSYYIAVGKIKRELPYELLNLDIEVMKSCGKVFDLPDNLGTVVYAYLKREELEKCKKLTEF